MLLTSTALQISTIVLAVLATIGVLLLWNRVRGPRAVRALSRVALLGGGYAATAVLISVNIAYGGLIVSVSDLFSNLNPPQGTHFGHTGKNAGGGFGYGAGPYSDWNGNPSPRQPTAGPSAVHASAIPASGKNS
jgi:hypothetical protein